MTLHRHPQARAEARHLVDEHDGSAGKMVEEALDARLAQDEIEEALQLDQVRREIGQIYAKEGR